jgi:hypothetical protein
VSVQGCWASRQLTRALCCMIFQTYLNLVSAILCEVNVLGGSWTPVLCIVRQVPASMLWCSGYSSRCRGAGASTVAESEKGMSGKAYQHVHRCTCDVVTWIAVGLWHACACGRSCNWRFCALLVLHLLFQHSMCFRIVGCQAWLKHPVAHNSV